MIDLIIFKNAFRDLLRAKRVLIALALMIAPSAIALLWRFASPSDFDPYETYNTLTQVMIYGFILIILSVVFGTGVIAQEVEQKTIVYMLIRPVPRWRLILDKLAAAVIGIIVTVLGSTLLLAGTVFAFATENGGYGINGRDVKDWASLTGRLKDHDEPISEYLYTKLSENTRKMLNPKDFNDLSGRELRRSRNMIDKDGTPRQWLKRAILKEINEVVNNDQKLYEKDRFVGYVFDKETQSQFASLPNIPSLTKFNRRVLEQSMPDLLAPKVEPVFKLKQDLWVLPIGALAYGALFLLLATLLNRPMMYGLVFAFGWESWVPNMPGRFQMVSIMTYLRTLAPHPQPGSDSVSLVQFLSGVNKEEISTAVAKSALLGITVVALVLALLIFSNNEYVPREDAE